VLPFFEEHDVNLLRVLTDRGSEFCGNPERHELYLAIEEIDHSRTKTKSPQTNGICERFHKTVLTDRSIASCRPIWTRRKAATTHQSSDLFAVHASAISASQQRSDPWHGSKQPVVNVNNAKQRSERSIGQSRANRQILGPRFNSRIKANYRVLIFNRTPISVSFSVK
jgi:transposase InsO family protein